MRILFFMIALILSPTLLANEWKLYSGNMELDTLGSSWLDQEYEFISIRTTDPNTPEVRFSCNKQYGLKTTIIFEPKVSRKEQTGTLKYAPRRSALAIDGRKKVSVWWTHVRKARTIQNRQKKAARMLFNAVIQNADFEVKEPFEDYVRIDLPPVDDEFRKFKQLCHITRA